jgi:FtsP/CotA-like multicopper oxidase with cupredoxin domain
VRYAPQHLPVGAQNLTYSFDPNALGRGYVWHCHILEHEDNEMMRPYAVIPQPGAIRTFVQGIDY